MPPKRDYSGLLPKDDPTTWMRPFMERAQARVFKFKPVSVEDRFAGFRLIHFQPHGLYVPSDPDEKQRIETHLHEIGRWEKEDDRLKAYLELQQETEQLYKDGVLGSWEGQQALARSLARFRLAAWGRRGGKTKYAAAEALGIAMIRPRSTIWLAAPISKLTGRAFDYVIESLIDLGMADDCRIQNQDQVKKAVLPNGSTVEGVSCENVLSMAGAAVDFCVLDEAAQIVPDVFYRGIIPPLTDRDGGALLISSYEGEGDFFSEKVLEVQAEAEKARARGDEFQPDWELFQGASYDMNFYAFPKGIDSDALVAARRNMPVVEFREQFGAEVAGARERVFPEFKERLHVGNYRFNPDVPVHLCCDPSSGANPYAILVLQDYPDRGYTIAIDELYDRLKAEDYDPIMRRKPWAANVVDMIIDSAWPDDMRRWNMLGWKCFPVKKPGIPESLPVFKNMLRNARLYDDFYQARVRYYMAQQGHDPDEADHLSGDDMKTVLYLVEESLTDGRLSPEDVKQLHDMSQFYISRSCVHFIHEMKAYHYRKRRNLNVNFQELPQDHDNHLIDGARYFFWTFKRWAEHDHPKLRSLMTYAPPAETGEGEEDAEPIDFAQAQGRLWLAAQRARHSPTRVAARSYLRRTA